MEQPFDPTSNLGSLQSFTGVADVRLFLELSPLPALTVDIDMRITVANPAAVEFLTDGTDSPEGKKLIEYVRSADSIGWLAGELRARAHGTMCELCEFKTRTDGTYVWGEVYARFLPAGECLLLINNISDRKKAEKSLLASEKQRWKMQRTEALQKLAGGIAHEFNNFLAVILLQTDLMNLQLPEGSPQISRVDEIREVANDAASIVRQLLAFGRRQAMNPAPLVINKLLESSFRDFKALLGPKIELILDLDPELGVSFVDSSHISQALMYLAMNAKDAMPEGGRLTIKTTNIDRSWQRIHKSQASGAYIQIDVIDTGIGMDPKTLDHAFEPFFSTKGSNKTAGLGLATVYGIIKQSGGYIWVTSVQNSGSIFKIQFPRIDQPKPATIVATEKKVANQMQTILLVDDEVSIRRVVAEGLRRSGYRVLEAGNGMDAVDIARTFPDPIHLVLADYSMPIMNGVEAAKRIKQFHPEARVLFVSGDPGTFGESLDERADANFLGKPFTLSGLTKKVQDILGY